MVGRCFRGYRISIARSYTTSEATLLLIVGFGLFCEAQGPPQK